MAKFHAVIERMVAKRRQSQEREPDLLTQLMEARDGTAQPCLTGNSGMKWQRCLPRDMKRPRWPWPGLMFLLATHAQAAERIDAEISFLNGRAPAYEDLSRLKFTRNVVEETMRLYPPVWVISRTAIDNDVLGGFQIPAQSEVLIFPYITHRHPRWWQDPERFIPERFSAENSAMRVRGAYIPFGAGPRICVGLNFAMTEVLVVLTMLLQRFRVELAVAPAGSGSIHQSRCGPIQAFSSSSIARKKGPQPAFRTAAWNGTAVLAWTSVRSSL